MIADSGSPSAPPTPSEELIVPVADPTRSGGIAARSTAMPSGMMAMPRPCRPRPRTNGTSVLLSAQTSDPAVNPSALTISIRRGPYMSPNRPNTGVATAAVSRVAVIAQEASAAPTLSIRGSSGITGTISVCISDTAMPAAESTTTSTEGCRERTLKRAGSTRGQRTRV